MLNKNTRGRVELGRIDLMPKFSFFEVEEKEAQNVMKSLNRANWNGRKIAVEVAGEESKETSRGSRREEGGNYGRKEFGGKKRGYKDEKTGEANSKRNKKSETASADKKRVNPAAKNVDIPKPEARKMTGDNSSKATITALKMQNPISAKRVGQEGHRKRNRGKISENT